MKMLNKWALALALVLSLLLNTAVQAQNTSATADAGAGQSIEMADRMRQDGKIYVVVGCVLVVLAGMIFYLVRIDQKVSRLEKQYKN
jgi:nitric oxide reductase large subunit